MSNVYRASTTDGDIGSDFIWSVVVHSPMVLPTQVFVHARNATAAKKIAREYAWRILSIPAATAPKAVQV
jgi:hypothetical protein